MQAVAAEHKANSGSGGGGGGGDGEALKKAEALHVSDAAAVAAAAASSKVKPVSPAPASSTQALADPDHTQQEQQAAIGHGPPEETPTVAPGNGSAGTNGHAAAVSESPFLDISNWQWLFSASDMAETPSVLQSGMTMEQERYCRWKGVQLILRIGDYMRLGNHVTTTAVLFFHRFFMRKAMPKEGGQRAHDTFAFQEMAPTCVFLACKVEETHRKLHGVIEGVMAVLDRSTEGMQRADARMYKVDPNSREYRRWKDIVLLHEERLLETLCFDLIVEQPHPVAIRTCQRLGVDREMARLTILILNTILHGAVCTFFDAATLAACAFFKACRYVDEDPATLAKAHAEGRSWADAFDVDKEEVNDALPDIDEYLAYHADRLQHQQRQQPPHLSSTKSSAPATPMHSQHTSYVLGDEEAHISASADTLRSGQKRAFTPGNGIASAGGSTHYIVSPKVDESRNVDAASDRTPAKVEERGQGFIDRDERRDAPRPISRHGSKEGRAGPPPPMARPSVAGSYAPISPKLPSEDDPPHATHINGAVGSTHADKRTPASQATDSHEQAAAEKVRHDQAKLEGRRIPEDVAPPERPRPAPPSQPSEQPARNNGDESEEEGAL